MIKIFIKYYVSRFLFNFNGIRKIFIFYKFNHTHSYKLNLSFPKTFNEKIQYFKLHDSKISQSIYADKELVRLFVEEKLGPELLIPVIKVLNKSEVKKFDFSSLSVDCVLKATHGSGWVEVLRNVRLKNFDIIYLKKLLNLWLKFNYYYFSLEPQYQKLKPKIIIEKLMLEQGELPIDYKFHCFNGRVEFIHVATGREGDSGRGFYDSQWKELNFFWSPLSKNKKFKKKRSNNIKKPDNLSCLISAAEKLATDFKYVRVDLYNVAGKIFFGELTFHPGSGFDVFDTFEADLFYGSKLDITNDTLLK